MMLLSCLYCAGDRYEPWLDEVKDRLGFVPGTRSFYRCRSCGSAILSPFPKTGDLVSFYPPVYDFSVKTAGEGRFKAVFSYLEYQFFFRPQYEAQVRQILGHTGTSHDRCRKSARLLDVGAGQGFSLLAFRKYGYEVYATDFRPEVVEYLQRHLGIPAKCADAAWLSQHFPENFFDLITAFHVLEHLPDIQKALQECWYLLKPGGWFTGTVPLGDSFQAAVFKSQWAGATEAPRHLTLPSTLGLQKLFAATGFEKISIRPATLSGCVGVLVLSLLPAIGTRHFDQKSFIRSLALAMLGVAIGLIAGPWCLIENYVIRKPSVGFIFAKKPES